MLMTFIRNSWMKRTYLASAILAVTANIATATTIYSWTDENGKVYFSDQPTQLHAHKITLSVTETSRDISPILVNQTTNKTVSSTVNDSPLTELPATIIDILSPINQQTLRNNNGDITLIATSNHSLNNNIQAQLLIGKKVYGKPQSTLKWTLTNMDRGSHHFQIQLIKNGKVLASSKSITVYLHRASLAQTSKTTAKPR